MPIISRRNVVAVLVGGGVAGVCDITYAITYYGFRFGAPPSRILQSVASGLLGEDSFTGGAPTAALGLALHFFIAFSAAAVYVATSRYIRILTARAVPCGITFGTLVYAFMNLIVIPLSRVPPRRSFALDVLITGLLVHMFLIGLPIALAARRFGERSTNAGDGAADH